VLRTERLTPHMQRVVLGGDGLAEFAADTCTDHYVKILFPAEGATYPEPFDMQRIREEFAREQWPVTRTYTVRHWDAEHRELTLDFVVHGDEGLAGPWAARVQPGETVPFMGPGGAYAPDTSADWHLLAGDESALPAIARSLEALPAGVRAYAFVEVAGPEEEQKIDSDVEVVWLHRGDRPVGEALVAVDHEVQCQFAVFGIPGTHSVGPGHRPLFARELRADPLHVEGLGVGDALSTGEQQLHIVVGTGVGREPGQLLSAEHHTLHVRGQPLRANDLGGMGLARPASRALCHVGLPAPLVRFT
jgi:NADPH-dependent ferric siderophore reductase